MSESTAAPSMQDASSPTPGCSPLPAAQFLALRDAARLAMLDARATIQARLIAGEGVTTLEADLPLLLEWVLGPLRMQLLQVAAESALRAGLVASTALLHEALVGDLRVVVQLQALAAAAQTARPAG